MSNCLIFSEMAKDVGSAGLSIEGTVVQSHLPPFRNFGNFVHPTFAYVFRMPGDATYPTQGVNV